MTSILQGSNVGAHRRSAELALRRELLQNLISKEESQQASRSERAASEILRVRSMVDDALHSASLALSTDAPNRMALERSKVCLLVGKSDCYAVVRGIIADAPTGRPLRQLTSTLVILLFLQDAFWRTAETLYPDWKVRVQARRALNLSGMDSQQQQSRAATTQLIRQVC